MVRKMISIRENQAEWIEDHCISLSKVVQKHLDELMKKKNV